MVDFFASFLRITAGMSLLSLLILLSTPLLKKRYTARWRCWVWLVIAVRLLIPIQLPAVQLSDFGGFLGESLSFPAAVRQPGPVLDVPSRPQSNAVQAPALISQTEAFPGQNTAARPSSDREEKQPEEKTVFWQDWREKLQTFPWMKAGMILWIFGAAGTLVIHGAAYFHMRRVLKAHARPIQNLACRESWEKVRRQAGYHGPLRLMRCQAVASPVVCGPWPPVLLLPQEDYPTTVLEMIFRHELVHVMRRDLWYKLLLLAVLVVHWFNPVVHWMVQAANRDLEISCDERVIARQSSEFRAQYSEAIFGVLRQSVGKRFLFSTSFCDEKKTLMQRFSAIFDTNRKRHGVLLMSFVFVACLLTGSLAGCQTNLAPTGGESAEKVPSSAEALYLEPGAFEQMHRTASLYESYCNGSERVQGQEQNYLTSFGFGYLLEDGQLEESEHQDYSVEASALAQIDQFFLDGAWEDWNAQDTQDIYHFSTDYQITGEAFFTLEQTDVRQLENGDIAVNYQRKTDKAVLRPVCYTFRPQQVKTVPDSLKSAFSVGDTVYQIVSITNLEVQPPQSQVIEIANAEQLLEAAKRINEGGWMNQEDTYILTADIDLTGVDFIPMGMNERYLSHWDDDDARDPSRRGFNGVFDGQGHTISHLRLDAAQLEYLGDPHYVLNGVGLFANIGANGVVKNLKLEDCTVTSPLDYNAQLGATGLLAAQCSGQVQNVSVQGTVEGAYSVGGLAGDMGGSAYNCSADVTARGFSEVGAFAGDASYAVLQNCTATGQVVSLPVRGVSPGDATPISFGGFIGFSVRGTVLDCDVSVYVSTTVVTNWVGAFGGYVQSFLAKNCTYDRKKAGNWEAVDVIYQTTTDYPEELDIQGR
ncbi:MAG: M56 family metallopeptidase [Oscillospiraceae bacterium]|nr:M56 family metallopeptidase [Oscillospiraceae bacterium]